MSPAEAAVAEAIKALRGQEEAAALEGVAAAARLYPDHARLQQALGMLHRALGDLEAAIAALDAAAALAPRDASIAHVRARAHLEAGLPAFALFERAEALAPSDGAVLLGSNSALLAEQGLAAATAALERKLETMPAWADGQSLLAKLRWMSADRAGFDAGFEQALAAASADESLWGAWLAALTQAERHQAVLDALPRARASLGPHALFDLYEASAHDDLGDLEAAAPLFAALGEPRHADVAICKIRHLLRTGQYDEAVALVERWLETPARDHFWPYASIAWRLTGDPRREWLEGDERLVGVYDLGAPPDALAARLRALHGAGGQPLDQSVRGGTQTDGALLSRLDPEIRALRDALVEAVQRHIAQLPPPDPNHPILGPRRDRPVRFSGSWSVRLAGAGHHANHLHPGGWLSSAYYVALPGEAEAGPAPAGWLTLGAPPAELGLDLPPLSRIEAKPGRLVLFPSTLWHGTEPFAAGERLTVAFDVARPV